MSHAGHFDGFGQFGVTSTIAKDSGPTKTAAILVSFDPLQTCGFKRSKELSTLNWLGREGEQDARHRIYRPGPPGRRPLVEVSREL